MEAMAQLRRDLKTFGCHVTHQAPAHSHDVRGWFLTSNSREEVTMTVACWNINGLGSSLSTYKPEYIAMIMQQDNIDIMICTDTRHSQAYARSIKKLFVKLLGVGTKVYCSKDPNRRTGEPGGITIIIGPQWGPSYMSEDSRSDASGHGALARIHLRTDTGFMAILGTYWPEKPSDKSVSHRKGLWSRILEFRQQQKAHNPDPTVYIQELTLQWLAQDRQNGCQCSIIGGDMNSRWFSSDPGGQRSIKKWCEDNYLINGPRLIHDRFVPPPRGTRCY